MINLFLYYFYCMLLHLALKNLILRINSESFPRVFIFGDSSAAILAISNKHHSEMQIKKDRKILTDQNIQILFQWIPSHVKWRGRPTSEKGK